MRVLLIPISPEDDKEHEDLLAAFHLHGEAHLYQDPESAIKFKPDVVFYQAGVDRDWETLILFRCI